MRPSLRLADRRLFLLSRTMYRGSFRNGGNLFLKLPPCPLGREQHGLQTKRPANAQSFLQPNGEEEVVRTTFQPQMFVIHSLINSSSQIARHIAICPVHDLALGQGLQPR
jgi:hypothetical protein